MNITMEDYATYTNTNSVSELNLTEQATISIDQDIYNSSLNWKDNGSNLQSILSYKNASKNASPSINQVKVTTTPTSNSQNYWTDQIKRIMEYHENGARTLIIMRGVRGSGKTYLAKKIIDAIYSNTTHQQYHTHIFSTDNYFVCNGVYIFNKTTLPKAHEWNKCKATGAMRKGVSPIIIDNTNIKLWHFDSYIDKGEKNGYIIELVEPNTPWAKNANELYQKNLHSVPLYSIRKMLYNFESGENIIKKFEPNYQFNKRPSILRKIPVFPSLQDVEEIEKKCEKGENWDNKPQNESRDSEFSRSKGSKPQRQNRLLQSEKPNKVLSSVSLYKDWNKLSTLLPPWEQNNQITKLQRSLPVLSKVSSSTCIEYDDTNISSTKNPLKIITATSRDINKYSSANVNNKMPEKFMIDTSTSTNNDEFFQYTYNSLKEYRPLSMRKEIKENVVSETSMQSKRQIEQNVISNNYYSEHSLKIRCGEYESNEPIKHKDEINSTESLEKHLIKNDKPTTTNILQNSTELSKVSHWHTPSTSKVENVITEICDDDSLVSFDNVEIKNTQKINIGKEFISQLDMLFGRSNWQYPHNIEPRINMPISLLNKINTLWMESVMFQMEDNAI